MENQLHDESIFSIEVSPAMKDNLRETVKWGKFLAIMGFIGIGFLLLGALIVIGTGAAFGTFGGAMGSSVGLVYFIVCGLYFYPTYALYKFSSLTRLGLEANDQPSLDEGFRYMKNMFRFMGILTIVILAFYALLFIGGILVAATR